MAMVDGFIQIDTLTPTVLAFGQAFPRAITAVAKVSAVKVAPQIRELAQAPRGVAYPIRWTSVKQRRAFFVSNGFGKGIPYRRTGNIPRAWQVEAELVDNVTVVAISNPAEGAEYVYGRVDNNAYQQGFHRTTSWPTANEVVQVGQELLIEDMSYQLAPAVARLLEVR